MIKSQSQSQSKSDTAVVVTNSQIARLNDGVDVAIITKGTDLRFKKLKNHR